MSKGVYIRRIHKLDNCEWKWKQTKGSKYPCNNKATAVVQSPKKGVIWKLCSEHAYRMLGTRHGKVCNNCGCVHSTVRVNT